MDDDVTVDPDFLDDALASIENGRADVVAAESTTIGASVWLTGRGHFRRIEAGDPISVGLACSLWRTDLFHSLWLDERIDYGYEDADLSLRLYRSASPMVIQSVHQYVHRGDEELREAVKDQKAERARGYVSVKRYGDSRRALARFLFFEICCNSLRRRRLLPPGQVHGQWLSVARYLLGAEAPAWSRPDAALVSEPTARGDFS